MHRIESPGEDYLPPLAASVTAAARMLLCLATGMLARESGRNLYVDTDGIDIDIDPAAAARVRWQMEALLDVPDEIRDWVHSMDADGNWVRVPQPRVLRSRCVPEGVQASTDAAEHRRQSRVRSVALIAAQLLDPMDHLGSGETSASQTRTSS